MKMNKTALRIFMSSLIIVAIFALNIIAVSAIEEATTNGTIIISADDAYKLYLDCVEITKTSPATWSAIDTYNVNLTDDFLIAVEAKDLHDVIAGLSIKVTIGTNSFDLSDAKWRQTISPDSAKRNH